LHLRRGLSDLLIRRNARHAKTLPYKKVRTRTASRHVVPATFGIDRVKNR
jgi:hypothetical protein